MSSDKMRVRSLAQEYVDLVLPHLPPTTHVLNREELNQSVIRMNMAKERSLTQFWPQLREEVETENIRITMRDGAQVPLRIYTPKNSKIEFGKRKVVFAIHGGGFVAGSVDSDDLINRQYCYQTHAHVFSLGYRLAPEYPLFPTIVNDSEDGLKWTYENAAKYGGDVSRGIFLSGTSSGGYLVQRLAFQHKKLNIPVFGVIMRGPVFILCPVEELFEWKPELREHITSYEENYDAPGLTGEAIKGLHKILAVSVSQHQNPEDFPIFASKEELKARMPQTHMMWGTTDPLADEVQYFQNRLVEAGVKNTFITYEGMPHAFNAHHVLSQARKETLDTADVLRKMIAASDAESA